MPGEVDFVTSAFESAYPGSAKPSVYRAPGRVNLIGEHTDYNEGFVLPIAIDLACYAAVAPSNDGRLVVRSENVGETEAWPLDRIQSLTPRKHWTDYVIGVAQELERLGRPILPSQILIHSSVPTGSGLSSSAAIEVATALALLGGRPIAPKELALLAQRAERNFVGVPCGIMDQYVSVFGQEQRAVQLDCRTVTHQLAPLPGGVAIVAVNSMVKHDLGTSAYATRVAECAEAVARVQASFPQVRSLRDVSASQLDTVAPTMSDNVHRRARHVITENERVQSFVAASERGDLLAMGRLFLASHRSLQRDYEVSCPELDFLVEASSDFSGVFGARMTGGGFGGCTVNLVDPSRVPAFEEHISEAYRRNFDLVPKVYRFVPAAGASVCPE